MRQTDNRHVLSKTDEYCIFFTLMPTDRRHGNLVNVSLRGTKEMTVDITILSEAFSKNKQSGLPPHTPLTGPLGISESSSPSKKENF